MLLFIYTDALPDASDEALLEDLISADRYSLHVNNIVHCDSIEDFYFLYCCQHTHTLTRAITRYHLDDMKVLCESMLVPSESNWEAILHASELINSSTLKRDVLRFLRENLSLVTSMRVEAMDTASDTKEVQSNEEAVQSLSAQYPDLLEEVMELRRESTFRPPSQLYLKRIEKNSQEIDLTATRAFPIWYLLGLGVMLYIYQHLSNIVSLGYFIPVINVVVLGVLFYFLLRKLATD